ncbi:MAG: hypothetical protein M3R02_27540 [Chloroflexota bacterium]|nr:hypothetical protein [Chloroflexota bacterium]
MPTRWKTVEDLRPHLDPIVEELGRMPTQDELKERGLGYLIDAVQKFGRQHEVAKALGYRYEGRRSWTQVEDLRPHLDPIVVELRRMPSPTELQQRNQPGLTSAIRKFGGPGQVARLLGYPYFPHKSWAEIEDLRPHLDPIVAEVGRMPSQRELEDRQRLDLANAIGKFGGFPAVAQALGYPHRARGSWRTVEDLQPHLEPIAIDLGRMPTARELVERGRTDLTNAIGKLGGYPQVASTLGYFHHAPSAWTTIESLREPLAPIVLELGRMPRKRELIKRGRGDLASAVQKLGGYEVVANALGYAYDLEKVRRPRWYSVEDLRPYLDPLVAELGRMPKQDELLAGDEPRLAAAIEKFGGVEAVAQALDYSYTGPKFWRRVEDLKPHLDPLVKQLGRMPSLPELLDRKCMT